MEAVITAGTDAAPIEAAAQELLQPLLDEVRADVDADRDCQRHRQLVRDLADAERQATELAHKAQALARAGTTESDANDALQTARELTAVAADRTTTAALIASLKTKVRLARLAAERRVEYWLNHRTLARGPSIHDGRKELLAELAEVAGPTLTKLAAQQLALDMIRRPLELTITAKSFLDAPQPSRELTAAGV